MKRTVFTIFLLMFSISIFAEEIPEKFWGIYTTIAYSYDGGETIKMGDNEIFCIVEENKILYPDGCSLTLEHLSKTVTETGEEYYFLYFHDLGFVWTFQKLPNTNVMLHINCIDTNRETVRKIFRVYR